MIRAWYRLSPRGRIALVVAVLALTALGGGVFATMRAAAMNEAGFIRACVLPETPADARCGDRAAIKSYFRVDIDEMIERRRARMASTVQRIVSGELRKADAYNACVAGGECARVPLLPENSDLAQVAAGSDYLDTRKAFWQLAEDSDLTPEICAFIDVCEAMRRLGHITF